MKPFRLLGGFLLTALICAAPLAAAQRITQFQSPGWTKNHAPFRIAGNLYYVGSEALAAYIVATPQGLILINSNLDSSVPQIRKNIETLGFKFSDVKILLISHAHIDHCAGSAEIFRQTHAKNYVMDADVSVVESGGKTDFEYGADNDMHFPPAHVDRALHDGDTVTLGGVTLTAYLTAGHTKGTTTWTLDETENGRTLHVVIVGSPNVNKGYKLINNSKFPNIADAYKRQFQVLKSLPCDIFLGSHGDYFGLDAKYPRFKNGDKEAFIDPAGYKSWVANRQQAFERELARQQSEKN
jgi:metallo-beta-lactamase class B